MTFALFAIPLSPLVGSAIDCDPLVFDQAYLLRAIDRSYPTDYIFSIKQKHNGGYEQFQSAAAVMARVSLAVSRMYCCAFLMSASGGLPAIGSVEFFREDFTAGAITIEAGTIVSTDDGRDFVLTSQVTFGATDLGPHTAALQSVAPGYEYNLPGESTTAGGETLAGAIGIIKRLVTSVPAIDPNMQVRQLLSTTGGQDACLDGLGNDILIFRALGEDDPSYRVRILETPDTVSPGAIQRGVDKILQKFGSAGCLREVGTPKFPGAFFDAGASTDSPQRPETNFAWDMRDDLRPEDRFKLYLDMLHFRGYFLVGVPPVVEPSLNVFFDVLNQQPTVVPNFYDTQIGDALPLLNPYDSAAILGPSLYKSVFAIIEAKRAGGVIADLYVENVGCF